MLRSGVRFLESLRLYWAPQLKHRNNKFRPKMSCNALDSMIKRLHGFGLTNRYRNSLLSQGLSVNTVVVWRLNRAPDKTNIPFIMFFMASYYFTNKRGDNGMDVLVSSIWYLIITPLLYLVYDTRVSKVFIFDFKIIYKISNGSNKKTHLLYVDTS